MCSIRTKFNPLGSLGKNLFEPKVFSFTIDTRKDSWGDRDKFEITISGGFFTRQYDMLIDWGDNTFTEIPGTETNLYDIPHTYSSPGIYQVKITSNRNKMTPISFSGLNFIDNPKKIISVDTPLLKVDGLFEGMFSYLPELQSIPINILENNPDTVSLKNFISNCPKLILDPEHLFDFTHNVLNYEDIFSGDVLLYGTAPIIWDTEYYAWIDQYGALYEQYLQGIQDYDEALNNATTIDESVNLLPRVSSADSNITANSDQWGCEAYKAYDNDLSTYWSHSSGGQEMILNRNLESIIDISNIDYLTFKIKTYLENVYKRRGYLKVVYVDDTEEIITQNNLWDEAQYYTYTFQPKNHIKSVIGGYIYDEKLSNRAFYTGFYDISLYKSEVDTSSLPPLPIWTYPFKPENKIKSDRAYRNCTGLSNYNAIPDDLK